MDIKKNDQVMVRKKIRSGTLVRIGSVLSVDGDKARVHFPIDQTQVVVPIAQLEKTSTRFSGYSRVQPSAAQRSILSPKNR